MHGSRNSGIAPKLRMHKVLRPNASILGSRTRSTGIAQHGECQQQIGSIDRKKKKTNCKYMHNYLSSRLLDISLYIEIHEEANYGNAIT